MVVKSLCRAPPVARFPEPLAAFARLDEHPEEFLIHGVAASTGFQLLTIWLWRPTEADANFNTR